MPHALILSPETPLGSILPDFAEVIIREPAKPDGLRISSLQVLGTPSIEWLDEAIRPCLSTPLACEQLDQHIKNRRVTALVDDLPINAEDVLGRKPEKNWSAELGREALYKGYFDKPRSALSTQVGGNHYKSLAIQPVEYISKNNIPYLEGNVIKYVTRHASKGGRADLEKARHYIDLILELQYPPA